MHTNNHQDIYEILKRKLISSDLLCLPENAKYTPEETWNVILHAGTSEANSLEAAANDLIEMYPESRVPTGDTEHNYIKSLDEKEVLSSFQSSFRQTIKDLGLQGTFHIFAIDFHDVAYYGNRNTPGIRGIKPKGGTSWGHSLLTTDMVENLKLTVDVLSINGLNKDYGILIEGIINRIERNDLGIKFLLLDREFFNLEAIKALEGEKKQTLFIMPAKTNKRLNKAIKKHEEENGRVPGVIKYSFKDETSPEFSIVLKPNKYYDGSKKEEKDNKRFFAFATNKEVSSVEEFTYTIPREYRMRWNIETGYRMKNIFKIRTCSLSPVVRLFLFLIQCILHNFLNILKHILFISAYTMKCSLNRELHKSLACETNETDSCSFPEFFYRIKDYNERRRNELALRLSAG